MKRQRLTVQHTSFMTTTHGPELLEGTEQVTVVPEGAQSVMVLKNENVVGNVQIVAPVGEVKVMFMFTVTSSVILAKPEPMGVLATVVQLTELTLLLAVLPLGTVPQDVGIAKHRLSLVSV